MELATMTGERNNALSPGIKGVGIFVPYRQARIISFTCRTREFVHARYRKLSGSASNSCDVKAFFIHRCDGSAGRKMPCLSLSADDTHHDMSAGPPWLDRMMFAAARIGFPAACRTIVVR